MIENWYILERVVHDGDVSGLVRMQLVAVHDRGRAIGHLMLLCDRDLRVDHLRCVPVRSGDPSARASDP